MFMAKTTEGPDLKSGAEFAAATFRRSHAQKMALEQLAVDAIWAPTRSGPEPPFDVEPFLSKLLEALMVYGYAMFRLRDGIPEVGDNRLFYIEQGKHGLRPRAYERSMSSKMLRGKWHLVVFEPPYTEMHAPDIWTTISIQSAAARAQLHSLSLDELTLHRRQRNMYNSQPTVFMADVRGKDKGIHWNEVYENEARADAASLNTFSSILRKRLGETQKLMEHDRGRIAEQTASGNAVGSVPTVPGGLRPTRAPGRQSHAELLLSSGMAPTMARHLDGDTHEATTSRDLTYAVYDAYRVPPGKFGLNRNTERMAGNLIISQQPMQIYGRHISRVVTVLNAVLAVCSPGSKLTPALDASVVGSLVNMLTPQAAKELLASSHGIDADMFDVDRIANLDADTTSHAKRSETDKAQDKLAIKP
jgi:hypothetical protein